MRNTNGTPEPSADVVDAGVLQHRDYIRTALHSLPAALARQILLAMEERRARRRSASLKSTDLPQMSVAEMQREIAWRLETLPPEDAEAIAELVRRLETRG